MANLEGSKAVVENLMKRWAEVEATIEETDKQGREGLYYDEEKWLAFWNSLNLSDFIALANTITDVINGWKRDSEWLEDLRFQMEQRTADRLRKAGLNPLDHLKKDR